MPGAALAPDGVVRLLGGLDRAVDILGGAARDVGDDLVKGRGADLDRLAAAGGRVLVVDEEADREVERLDRVALGEGERRGEVVLRESGDIDSVSEHSQRRLERARDAPTWLHVARG